ncbi:hypothetical protein P9847_14315 [Paenibacillus chibensis]|uniref:Uncharacterized protein n=1 Tax=Paenibacillus chibensis TaxID=59846 RepID=A0ABU6PUA7_9BACL|nr:hypothetical protein [Paenibacillus chibensis]
MAGYFFFLSIYVNKATMNAANTIVSEKEKFIHITSLWSQAAGLTSFSSQKVTNKVASFFIYAIDADSTTSESSPKKTPPIPPPTAIFPPSRKYCAPHQKLLLARNPGLGIS